MKIRLVRPTEQLKEQAIKLLEWAGLYVLLRVVFGYFCYASWKKYKTGSWP